MKHCILFFAVLVIAISCDNENVTPVADAFSLMNLKVGNYWVYDWYEINSATNEATSLGKRDSAVIEKDTIINGRTCFIKKVSRRVP